MTLLRTIWTQMWRTFPEKRSYFPVQPQARSLWEAVLDGAGSGFANIHCNRVPFTTTPTTVIKSPNIVNRIVSLAANRMACCAAGANRTALPAEIQCHESFLGWIASLVLVLRVSPAGAVFGLPVLRMAHNQGKLRIPR